MPALLPKVEAPDTGPEPDKEEPKDESPEVDIVINNVVCSFSVRCHLNLKEIALNGSNVEYRRENGMVTMKLRLVLINVIICLVHVFKMSGTPTPRRLSGVRGKSPARGLTARTKQESPQGSSQGSFRN